MFDGAGNGSAKACWVPLRRAGLRLERTGLSPQALPQNLRPFRGLHACSLQPTKPPRRMAGTAARSRGGRPIAGGSVCSVSCPCRSIARLKRCTGPSAQSGGSLGTELIGNFERLQQIGRRGIRRRVSGRFVRVGRSPRVLPTASRRARGQVEPETAERLHPYAQMAQNRSPSRAAPATPE